MNHSTIVPKPACNLAQANRPRSGERGPLAQAKPFSPRQDHSSLQKNARRLGDNSSSRSWASLW